jgi:hypothetical protein
MKDVSSFASPKVYGFYHICCLGAWKEIVSQQVSNLLCSPLYDSLDRLFVCIIVSSSENEDLNYCNTIFPEKFVISIIEHDLKVYEYPILRLMRQMSERECFYGFYFHSKGVTVNHKKRGVPYWRKEMEYFLFHRFDLVINSFELGYNTYGPNLRAFPGWNNVHFSGNFWFAKSSYIKTLPRIPDNIEDRYFAEEWIGKGQSLKPYVPFNTFIDLYHVPLPQMFYQKYFSVNKARLNEVCLFVFYFVRGYIFKKQKIE